MRVIADGYFTIYVYASEVIQRHHLPHCHIRSPAGETVVALPNLTLLAGENLNRRAKTLLYENLEEIYEAWNKLNS